MSLLRSNVEFAKRIFLDRLTTDAQPLLQKVDIDDGPGDDYVYGGTYSPNNFSVGADCSGSSGVFISAAMLGPAGMSWSRLFSTETFPAGLPAGWKQVPNRAAQIAANPTMTVVIHHGGGGPDSHMNCWIDGWLMESNGTYGTCTTPWGGMDQSDSYWNDWWVYTDPIIEDTTWRQPMGYVQGVDYAGGRISGADLKAANISFVCRYINDGGSGLPNKLITAGEFNDLVANGIGVVFNYETTSDFMLGDQPAGITDAQQALAFIRSLPGMSNSNPFVYFSADFDEAPAQDASVEGFMRGANSVLGSPQGLYGDYWIGSRALNAGVVGKLWQTEAWSGNPPNIDSRISIMQRNALGFKTIGGVQCDIDEAHVDLSQIGAYFPGAPVVTPPPVIVTPPPGVPVTVESTDDQILDQEEGPVNPATGKRGWPQLQNLSQVDFLGLVLYPAVVKLQATMDNLTAKLQTPATTNAQPQTALHVPVPKAT